MINQSHMKDLCIWTILVWKIDKDYNSCLISLHSDSHNTSAVKKSAIMQPRQSLRTSWYWQMMAVESTSRCVHMKWVSSALLEKVTASGDRNIDRSLPHTHYPMYEDLKVVQHRHGFNALKAVTTCTSFSIEM